MKDENDRHTADMGEVLAVPAGRRKRKRKGEPLRPMQFDEASKQAVEAGVLPERVRIASGGAARYVPVAFVARDWGVTPRRVRALLAAGRLSGQLLPNGYWEVCYPYTYTDGLRGPMQRRHQRPAKTGLALVANNSERRPE